MMRCFRPLAVLALLMVAGCQTPAFPPAAPANEPQGEAAVPARPPVPVVPPAGYAVEILRSPYGVPHITAADFASLGYGEGYAAAEDHVCNISHALLAARGELARYLGPGKEGANVASDAVVAALDIRSQAVAALARQDDDNRAWLRGYADGYNRFLTEHPEGRVGSWCDGAAWLQPVADSDLMARMVLMAQTLPRMADALVAAQPPATAPALAQRVVSQQRLARAADAAALQGMGSNAWAFGKARSANGRGLLLGNPHYPWYGDNRFWEKHLTIPGKLDVYGGHLLGAPGVAIGFNRGVAWSHTVSASQRLVFYRLQLVPGKPTVYRYNGEERAMREVAVSVPVLQADGSLQPEAHTLYFSHYGPMLTLPGMPWDASVAFTARDANVGNDALLSQWRDMNLATDMDSFIAAHKRWNAMPWVNTIAASADGRAVYLDNSTVGRLSDEAIALWRQQLKNDALTAKVYDSKGFVLLDGSDPRFEWVEQGDAPIPGTEPFERRPLLEREDYVFNANDSYWLSNVSAPLTGYSPLYGPEATARSLRTRMNAQLIEEGAFTLARMQELLFDNESLAALLLVPPLLEACSAAADLADACAALRGFNGRFDLDSRGAVLFREWLTGYTYEDCLRQGDLFAVPFDAAAPVTTPNTLADSDLAMQKLAHAAAVLASAGYPLDAPLREAQFAYRGERGIPVHGGNRYEGVANLMVSDIPHHPIAQLTPTPIDGSRLLTDAGYPVVHGSSFILTVGFEDSGPVAEALLTYSQSGDPASPHFTDQTELYRNKQFRPVLFQRQDVEAAAQSRITLTAPR
ncbi:MAG: peptidase S45 [Haliea sp.]|uniref:penicillin acylase family protein n=1 Tax=Haliea sp. TaxID=1932666 RepID=UPI000C4C4E17|nr:penicillin acylase family protein [Haliea sp.]MBM70440.1 peptidase S45 [Haliea sp.]|tara:strand:- start:102 stop:2519 length:2418 start_codon:yes stop_codon:yes gene_type:complete